MDALVQYIDSLKCVSDDDLDDEKILRLVAASIDGVRSGATFDARDFASVSKINAFFVYVAPRMIAARAVRSMEFSRGLDKTLAMAVEANTVVSTEITTIDSLIDSCDARDAAFALWCMSCVAFDHDEYTHWYKDDEARKTSIRTCAAFADIANTHRIAIQERAALKKILGDRNRRVVDSIERERLAREDEAERRALEDQFSHPIAAFKTDQVIAMLELWTWRFTDWTAPMTDEIRSAATTLFLALRSRVVSLCALKQSVRNVAMKHIASSEFDSDRRKLGEAFFGSAPVAVNEPLSESEDDASESASDDDVGESSSEEEDDDDDEEEEDDTIRVSVTMSFVREARCYVDWIQREIVCARALVDDGRIVYPEFDAQDTAALKRLEHTVLLSAFELDEHSIRRDLHTFIAQSRIIECDAEIYKVRFPYAAKSDALQVLMKKNELELQLTESKPAKFLYDENRRRFVDFALSLDFKNSAHRVTGSLHDVFIYDAWELRGWHYRPPCPNSGIFRLHWLRKYAVVAQDDWRRVYVFDSIIEAFVYCRRRRLIADEIIPADEFGKRRGADLDAGIFDDVVMRDDALAASSSSRKKRRKKHKHRAAAMVVGESPVVSGGGGSKRSRALASLISGEDGGGGAHSFIETDIYGNVVHSSVP